MPHNQRVVAVCSIEAIRNQLAIGTSAAKICPQRRKLSQRVYCTLLRSAWPRPVSRGQSCNLTPRQKSSSWLTSPLYRFQNRAGAGYVIGISTTCASTFKGAWIALAWATARASEFEKKAALMPALHTPLRPPLSMKGRVSSMSRLLPLFMPLPPSQSRLV